MKTGPLLIVFLFFCQLCNARAFGPNVSGRVLDAQGKALTGVTVTLLQTDAKTLVKADITNDKGAFLIDEIAAGEYILQASFYGFDVYQSEKIVLTDNKLSLPDIVLHEKSTNLKDVTIRAQKPLIEVHADKMVVNVENSIVSTGSSALEVLAKSPGVNVDNNDNISLKGKKGVTIMIDGKIVPVNGTDLANLLRSMPSNSIEKIELISNPSARYDAAGTGGIINIRTKKNKADGINGSLNGSYGQGVYPKGNLGGSLNYRVKKLNIYSNYNYSYRKEMNDLTLNRTFYQDGLFSTRYVQNNFLTFPVKSHNANVGVDYSLTPKTTLGASLNGNLTNYTIKGSAYTQVLDNNDERQSAFSTNNVQPYKENNYAVNLNLRHRFDSLGTEFSFDADYARYINSNYQDYITNYYLANGAVDPATIPYLLHADLSGLTQIRSVKADFSHPFKDGIRLDMGAKSSYVTADNKAEFYDRSNGGNVYDSSKSNHFIYEENINAVYANASKDWTKWSAQAGVRLEQSIAHGVQKVDNSNFDKQYAQLFPSLALQRHINADNDLGLTLSRRIERPSYDQLNPFKFYLDPTSYKEGNPYLNPSLTYSVELSHTYKSKFVTALAFSRSNDAITQVIQPIDTINHVTLITDKNLQRMDIVSLSGAYPFQFFKWWNSTNSINVYYSYFKGDLANTALSNGKPAFNFNSQNSFLLPHNWSAELAFNYTSSQVYGYMNLKPMWSLDVGVQKNFWDKRATVKMNITDIGWQANPSGTNTYNSYYEVFSVKRDSRVATLSFTYRFGKKSVAPARRRSGGAEEEKRRASK